MVDGASGLFVRKANLDASIRRALSESPAGSVFVEKAAVDAFHHVEVQIIGDGTGQIRHLWERDCSAQRRFQKVVECAPSLIQDRSLIARVIDSALRMASSIHYQSLGTFEFLVSETKGEFYFLEINPRLQVEHTITECISGLDLVQAQLLIAQGHTLYDVGLKEDVGSDAPHPATFSAQFRLCAEDPRNAFALSIGKVTGFHVPSGHGVRVDTNIFGNVPLVVGTDFDNLLAKIIITGSTWDAVVRKSRRVLGDCQIKGVKTNISLLRGIAAHPDFASGSVDTQWLEQNLELILHEGEKASQHLRETRRYDVSVQKALTTQGLPSSTTSLRKGDAWSLSLEPLSKDQTQAQSGANHLRLTRVLRNDFPTFLAADIEFTTSASNKPTAYHMQLSATVSSATAIVSASRRKGDPRNANHVVFPMPGKLMEILVSEGEQVVENQPLALIKQMKMELEIRSPRSGTIRWLYKMENDDEDVAEGTLLAELKSDTRSASKAMDAKL